MVAAGSGNARRHKKAGEYSEEDTHRPAHYSQLRSQRAELSGVTKLATALRKRRGETPRASHNWTVIS